MEERAMIGGRAPRSVSQEIASLDKAIEATERGATESANGYDAARNRYALEDLKELREHWVREQHRLRDAHTDHAWHMFCTHLRIAAEHFEKWQSLKTERR
jgi:hypothetical protein